MFLTMALDLEEQQYALDNLLSLMGLTQIFRHNLQLEVSKIKGTQTSKQSGDLEEKCHQQVTVCRLFISGRRSGLPNKEGRASYWLVQSRGCKKKLRLMTNTLLWSLKLLRESDWGAKGSCIAQGERA
jgi:hypothetical protein